MDQLVGHCDEQQEETASRFGIGDLARELGVTTRTIRFYESRGLITPQRVGGNRTYNRRDRARLQLILRGKRLGFSLDEICEYLTLYDTDPTQVTQLRHLIKKIDGATEELQQKRADIDCQLSELMDIRAKTVDHLDGK